VLNRLHYRATTDSLPRGRAFGNWDQSRGFVLAYSDKGLSHVLGVFDVIAFENGFCFVSCDLHCCPPINPHLNQIMCRTPAKIVRNQSAIFLACRVKCAKTKLTASLVPCPSEVSKVEYGVSGLGKCLRRPRSKVPISSNGPARGRVKGSSFFMISAGSSISMQSFETIAQVIFFAAPVRQPLKIKSESDGGCLALRLGNS
jgi:hypothetical protein